jgi:hypothetical protein
VTVLALLLTGLRGAWTASPAKGLFEGTPPIGAISSARHVPQVAIVGVVDAERALNIGVADRIQDRLLRTWLLMHSELWWTEWADRNNRLAVRAEPIRLLANKWPANLVASGYVFSFGPAQLTPRTVLRACRVASDHRPPCDQTIKRTMRRLLSYLDALDLVGVVLDAEATEWEQRSQYPVRKDVALLGTLYSMGGEYYRHGHPDLRLPVYNDFGKWIAERCHTIAAAVHAPPNECNLAQRYGS